MLLKNEKLRNFKFVHKDKEYQTDGKGLVKVEDKGLIDILMSDGYVEADKKEVLDVEPKKPEVKAEVKAEEPKASGKSWNRTPTK